MTQGKHQILRVVSSPARDPLDRLMMTAAVLAALLLVATPISAQQAGDGTVLEEPALDPGLLPPEGGELLPPVEGELLPPPEGEQAIAPDGGMLPPAEGQADSAAAVEEEIVVVDPAMQPPLGPLPAGMVRVVFQNRTADPLDIFLDAMDGSDPAWVLTIAGGFQVVQPSAVGQTWRLAQHDQWKGGFVPDATPTQILPFTGQP